jgi:hypothetical protein
MSSRRHLPALALVLSCALALGCKASPKSSDTAADTDTNTNTNTDTGTPLVLCPPDDLLEENDDYGTAAPLGAALTQTGLINCPNDYDYYSFEVGPNQSTVTIDVDFIHARGDINLQFWKGQTSCVGSSCVGSSCVGSSWGTLD